MTMEHDIDAVYRALAQMEKSVAEQFAQLREQLAKLSNVPVEVAHLKESSGHHRQTVDRLDKTFAENTDGIRRELGAVRDKAELTNNASTERYNLLSASIGHAADRIEEKFGLKLEAITKELRALVSDYDKRISALRAVAAVLSIIFVVLQGITGFVASSYYNAWKARIEDIEVSSKDIRKVLADNEARSEAVKKVTLDVQRRVEDLEANKR